MEMTEEVAEVLVNQGKIFSINFQKLLKVYAKLIKPEERKEVEDLVTKINGDLKGHSRAKCIFVLAYLIGVGYSVKDYSELDDYIGNFLI